MTTSTGQWLRQQGLDQVKQAGNGCWVISSRTD